MKINCSNFYLDVSNTNLEDSSLLSCFLDKTIISIQIIISYNPIKELNILKAMQSLISLEKLTLVFEYLNYLWSHTDIYLLDLDFLSNLSNLNVIEIKSNNKYIETRNIEALNKFNYLKTLSFEIL